jgi:hypothetical protein
MINVSLSLDALISGLSSNLIGIVTTVRKLRYNLSNLLPLQDEKVDLDPVLLPKKECVRCPKLLLLVRIRIRILP